MNNKFTRLFNKQCNIKKEVIEEEVESPTEIQKICSLEIHFKDGYVLQYTREEPETSKTSHIILYKKFYVWFYLKQSSHFTMYHRDGCDVFNREDILRIRYNEAIKNDN